jgi:hypothetical protein
MNDKRTGLEQMLKQATAPGDTPADDLGPEAQSLREAWLAFGQLLEAAEPRDSDSLLPRSDGVPLLQRSSARQDGRAVLGSRQAVAHRGRNIGLLVALAASLLIGLSVYWLWGGAERPGGVVPAGGNMATGTTNRAAPAAGELRWDDSLDQQIAQAGQGVALARSDLAHGFDATDFARDRLRQTEQDLEKSKL